MTSAQDTNTLTADLIAELDALVAEHDDHGFVVYADPNIPGLAWTARYGDDDDYDIVSGPVGADIPFDPEIGDDYDTPDLSTGRAMNTREAHEAARELLDAVERAGYPVGR